MIVVRIFKNDAGKFANLISAVNFEACKRRLRLYFSELEKVKERIIAGEIIDIPYMTFQYFLFLGSRSCIPLKLSLG
ncbi:unnamed protein product [marine sediment metagenome]|uniref:Uncharacterized protein n=1 Tax=marine sediment metagenome TaxID=412755 RepID=X1FLK5_9ZZZZ